MSRRTKAALTVTAAILLDVLWSALFARVSHLGFGTSLYWGLGAATTEGSSIAEHSGAQQLLKCLVEVTDLPFVLGTYALYQSWMVAGHVRAHIEESTTAIKNHIDGYLGGGL